MTRKNEKKKCKKKSDGTRSAVEECEEAEKIFSGIQKFPWNMKPACWISFNLAKVKYDLVHLYNAPSISQGYFNSTWQSYRMVNPM